MGNVFLAQKKYLLAQENYSKAISLNKYLFEPHFNQCLIFEYHGNYQKAIDCYTLLTDTFPDRPELKNNVGSLYLKSGKYKKAEELFIDAIKTDPLFKPAHYNIGKLYILSNEPEKALNHIDNILELWDEGALEQASEFCALIGDAGHLDEAGLCYEKILLIDQERALDIFRLGIVLLKKGMPEKAIAYFKRAYEMDSENEYFKQFMTVKDGQENK